MDDEIIAKAFIEEAFNKEMVKQVKDPSKTRMIIDYAIKVKAWSDTIVYEGLLFR